jgi:hypothetical protein
MRAFVSHTSGDASSRILAPLVSTWITRGAGNDGMLGLDMVVGNGLKQR